MFVSRDSDGNIFGQWTSRQHAGQEELPGDHPELLAIIDATNQKRAAVAAERLTNSELIADARGTVTTFGLRGATVGQISAFVISVFPGFTPTQLKVITLILVCCCALILKR